MADAAIRQDALNAVAECHRAMEEKFGCGGGFLDGSVLDALFRTGTDEDVKKYTASVRETTRDILSSTPVGRG